MNEKHLSIRNFRRYQHYKNRKPPWVKLLVDLLGDDQLNELPTATRLLALLLLCVAANRDNKIPNDPAWIATECSLTRKEAALALTQLQAIDYLIPASKFASNGASETASTPARNPLAPRARPRAHGETEAYRRTSSVVESVERLAADDDDKNDNEEEPERVDLAALGFDPADILGDL